MWKVVEEFRQLIIKNKEDTQWTQYMTEIMFTYDNKLEHDSHGVTQDETIYMKLLQMMKLVQKRKQHGRKIS